MIRPAPVIRISGRLTRAGAHISLLTVKTPKGVSIKVACSGASCPVRESAQSAQLWHMRTFERDLNAGTRLTITVSKPGYIAKVTTITIRRGKAPARVDRCEAPDAKKTSACP